MDRDTLQVLGILAIGVAAFLVFAGPFEMGTNEYTAFGLLLIGAAGVQSFTGKILPRLGQPISRTEEPKRFWIANGIYVVVGLGLFVWSFFKV